MCLHTNAPRPSAQQLYARGALASSSGFAISVARDPQRTRAGHVRGRLGGGLPRVCLSAGFVALAACVWVAREALIAGGRHNADGVARYGPSVRKRPAKQRQKTESARASPDAVLIVLVTVDVSRSHATTEPGDRNFRPCPWYVRRRALQAMRAFRRLLLRLGSDVLLHSQWVPNLRLLLP